MNFKIIAAVVGVLIAVPIGCSILNTATTVATAPGRVVNKTLQTDNIIMNYERFFDIKTNYDSRVAQFNQYKAMYEVEQDPTEKIRLRTEMASMQQSCRELANSYNNDSQKMNRSLFKDSDLPYTLSVTSCE